MTHSHLRLIGLEWHLMWRILRVNAQTESWESWHGGVLGTRLELGSCVLFARKYTLIIWVTDAFCFLPILLSREQVSVLTISNSLWGRSACSLFLYEKKSCDFYFLIQKYLSSTLNFLQHYITAAGTSCFFTDSSSSLHQVKLLDTSCAS